MNTHTRTCTHTGVGARVRGCTALRLRCTPVKRITRSQGVRACPPTRVFWGFKARVCVSAVSLGAAGPARLAIPLVTQGASVCMARLPRAFGDAHCRWSELRAARVRIHFCNSGRGASSSSRAGFRGSLFSGLGCRCACASLPRLGACVPCTCLHMNAATWRW